MAILTTFRHSGDPDALLATYHETLAPVIHEAGPANGHISTTMVRTETGLMVLSVWESEEGMRRAADQVATVARGSGMRPEDRQIYDVVVHDHR